MICQASFWDWFDDLTRIVNMTGWHLKYFVPTSLSILQKFYCVAKKICDNVFVKYNFVDIYLCSTFMHIQAFYGKPSWKEKWSNKGAPSWFQHLPKCVFS